jgi:LmbE family N-acetylglucosaminyl deacetylase
MATLVSFHAHPDDEAIPTGGTLARAADAGHRVVIVFATRGEHGEVDEGFLDAGEELWQRREQECHRAADVLGAARVEFLGFVDSGMMGTPENDAPGSFWRADVDEAAKRLAAILDEERADVLTVYDENGVYGHPDHIQIHRVGVRAAELAGTQRVYEATSNRDAIVRGLDEARAAGMDMPGDLDPDAMDNFGVREEQITTEVDVTRYLDRKRAAMAAHASQISESSFFLAMPPEFFARAFGTEWFIRRGAPAGIHEHGLLDGLD